MTDAAAGAPPPPSHRSRWFVLGYGAAQTGAFISFIPLLTLLLPEKAGVIGGADKALLLSLAAMLGGLTAAAANVMFGALSDRTHSRFGRRRPWILCGVAAVAISLTLLALARSPVQLVLGVIVFQIAVNVLYAPLTALVPDMVPHAQKGLISAWAGAALPVANLFTALVVSRLAGWTGAQFAVVGVAVAVLIVPFAVRLREPPAAPRQASFRLSLTALRDGRFRALFVSRLLAESAVAINTLYLLYWLLGLPGGATPAGWSVADVFASLLVVSTLAATFGGFAGGALSDRLRGRRGFVIAGSAGMALALGLMVGWSAWPGLLAAQLLFGLSHGVHATTVAAMTAESLPDPTRAGRDLGVMNIAIAVPQSLAPACAAVLLASGLPLSAVFMAAAAAALAASLVLAAARRRG
ncbi:MFS transporter [Brevundimonas sp.]|uniref:MFS transporter n=1 Tax=Brevundimonas sp. TaxID=1871086 RepID=UPI002D28EB09|nr:MFS transporter [Brevundimonas sp.]HYC98194.1 MFS transporter [Brevundimonas sp.]